jgi:hypothetical protein
MERTQFRIAVGVLTGVLVMALLTVFPGGLAHSYFQSLLSADVLAFSVLIVVGMSALMAWLWPRVLTAHVILVTVTFLAFGVFFDLAVFIALAFTSLVLWFPLFREKRGKVKAETKGRDLREHAR